MTWNLYLPIPESIPTEKNDLEAIPTVSLTIEVFKKVKKTPPGTYTYRNMEPIPTEKRHYPEPIPTGF